MENYNYIEKYFEGTLSPEETIMFNKLVEDDAVFAATFEYEKNVKRAITLNERKSLKQKLQSFETSKPKVKSLKIWYAAASIVFIFGLGFYFTQTSTTTIYDEYYQSYPNVVAPTVRGENKDDIKSEAFFEYDNGNYELPWSQILSGSKFPSRYYKLFS